LVEVFDPMTLTVGSMALTAAGSAVSAMGTLAGGNAANDAAIAGAAADRQAGSAAWDAAVRGRDAKEFEARQLEQAGGQSIAAAQRSAFERRDQGRLLMSKLQARAAASGGGATDPGVLDLAGNIADRSEYDALTEMFKGQDRANGLYDQATSSRLTGEAILAEGRDRYTAAGMNASSRLQLGDAQQRASQMAAAGTIIGGAGSAFSTYRRAPTSLGGGSSLRGLY
jgi:hypothetical protein